MRNTKLNINLKWFSGGLLTLFINNIALYALDTLINLNQTIAIVIAAESSLLARYLINVYFVFNSPISLGSILQFHVVNAFSFSVYMIAVYTLNKALNIDLYIAINSAVVISFIINYIGSFYWVWKKRQKFMNQLKSKKRLHPSAK